MRQFNAEKWKLIKYGLGFTFFLVAILLIIEYTLAYLVAHSSNEQTGKINLIMQNKIDPELIIFGSSVAEVGFATNVLEQKLNRSVYNMAIDGTTINGSEFLIDEFLDYTKKCDTVIIGMAFFSLTEINAMNAPERYLAHKTNIYVKSNINEISPSLYNRLYQVPFYSFVVANSTYYKNAFVGLRNLYSSISIDSDSLKGFVPHYTAYEDTASNSKFQDHISISKKSVRGYKNILKKIKAKGVIPILVITPMHMNGQKSFSNYDAFLEAVYNLSVETNTTLFDFSEYNIVNDNQYFYNNGHLNASGALKFSSAISDSLKPKLK